MILSKDDRILFIGAHPDDEVLGCGGFLHHAADAYGIETGVAIIGEGSTCREEATESDIWDRYNALRHACTELGVSINTCVLEDPTKALPCGAFNTVPMIDVSRIVERHIQVFEPTIIVTHYNDDNHRDHEVVNRAVRIASRPYLNNGIRTVLMCEILSSTDTSAFRPNVFIQLTRSDIDAKVRAMKHYSTEIFEKNHPRSEAAFYAQANLRGVQCGSEYAEAFMLQHTILSHSL